MLKISTEDLAKSNLCEEERAAGRHLLSRFGKGPYSIADMFKAGVEIDYVLSILCQLDRPDVERRLRLLIADYAAHVIHLYEKPRCISRAPREALRTARYFARGAVRAGILISNRATAELVYNNLPYTYRSPRRQALLTCIRACSMPETDLSIAVLGTCQSAISAIADDARRKQQSPEDAAAREKGWQRDRLIEWFSGEEPEDWPLS